MISLCFVLHVTLFLFNYIFDLLALNLFTEADSDIRLWQPSPSDQVPVCNLFLQ